MQNLGLELPVCSLVYGIQNFGYLEFSACTVEVLKLAVAKENQGKNQIEKF